MNLFFGGKGVFMGKIFAQILSFGQCGTKYVSGMNSSISMNRTIHFLFFLHLFYYSFPLRPKIIHKPNSPRNNNKSASPHN